MVEVEQIQIDEIGAQRLKGCVEVVDKSDGESRDGP